MDLEGKVAVVTGAAGGIGAATSACLIEAGASVLVVDRDAAAARDVADRLGPRARYVAADVSTNDGVQRWVDAAIEHFGGFDMLHNNAGIEGRVATLIETTAEEFDAVVAVNQRSVFLGLRAALRHFSDRMIAGSIVNTASEAGLEGVTRLGAYAATKHAVIGLTRTAALEAAGSGTRVNAVAPGQVSTRMMRSLETALGDPDTVHHGIAEAIPLGRYAQPSEIAEVVTWLLGPRSSFITGAVICADGGTTAGSVLPDEQSERS